MHSSTSRLDALLQQTRLVCFGRFVITVPATATVVYGPTQAESEIFFRPGEAEKIDALVDARLVEIKNERSFMTERHVKKLPLFGQVRDGIRTGQRIVIGSKEQVGYTVHSFIPMGDDVYVQYFEGLLPDRDPFISANDVAKELSPRLNDVIPAAPGVCIDHGFIAKDMRYEQSTIGIRFKEFPDVHLSIDVHKNLEFVSTKNELEVSLREGAQAAREDGKGYLFDQIKIFRHGPRRLGIWDGFEHAFRMPAYQTNTDAHEFYFHAMGAADDRLLPSLDIQFDSGVKGNTKAAVKPSITDEEALALWDAMIKTIRLRQPEDATPAKKMVPVGSVSSVSAVHCTVGDRPVARVGDVCTCPTHGQSIIVEGSAHHTVGGVSVAYAGHRTSCGATLISSAENFTLES